MDAKALLRRAVIAAAVIAAAYYALTPRAEPFDDLGRAPALSGADPVGRPIALSDFAGKVVLVAFWATWCPGCREEIPALEKLHERRKDQGFEVLGVSLDQDTSVVSPFIRSAGMTYPVMEIPGGKEKRPGWSLPGLPIAFLVGRDGAIVRRYDGMMKMDAVDADVKAALTR